MSRDEIVAKRLAESHVSAKGIMRRAYYGETGRAGAIKAMCLHCNLRPKQAKYQWF